MTSLPLESSTATGHCFRLRRGRRWHGGGRWLGGCRRGLRRLGNGGRWHRRARGRQRGSRRRCRRGRGRCGRSHGRDRRRLRSSCGRRSGPLAQSRRPAGLWSAATAIAIRDQQCLCLEHLDTPVVCKQSAQVRLSGSLLFGRRQKNSPARGSRAHCFVRNHAGTFPRRPKHSCEPWTGLVLTGRWSGPTVAGQRWTSTSFLVQPF